MAMISTAKVVAISAVLAVILASAMKLMSSAPMATELMSSHAPRAWSSVAAWLRPPYLYVVINGIIISIVASSRFYNGNHDHHDDHDHDYHHDEYHDRRRQDDWSPVDEKLSSATSVGSEEEDILGDDREMIVTVVPVPEVIKSITMEHDHQADDDDQDVDEDDHHDRDDDDDDDDEIVMIKMPKRTDIWEENISAEKPLVSAKFGHRKPVKPSPDPGGLGALKVTKPKQHETLENTWKAITEGRSTPLSRQMRKCDTWENHSRQITRIDLEDCLDPPSVKKSETFKDRTNQQLPAVPTACVLRKEPSLSQDELNRRVEEFIKKFNDQMRLQRQESLNQYLETINPGTH